MKKACFYLKRKLDGLVFIWFFLTALPVFSQYSIDTVSRVLVDKFNQKLSPQLKLYNGIAYLGQEGKWEGSPFFENNNEFVKGSIVYDSINFWDVPIQYDLVLDKIVTVLYDGYSKYTLINQKLSEFKMGNRKFIQIADDSDTRNQGETGFFEEVYTGKSKVLIKWSKTSQKVIDTYGVRIKFDQKIKYFALVNHMLYKIDNDSALWKIVGNRQAEVKNYLRQNHFNFKSNPLETVTKAIAFYDGFSN